jgi:DNA invertase Pin-like site-specific DNA recombinase
MSAAVYARKSTEQSVGTDAKSVTRQVELGRAFAEQRGWTVVEEYIDDAISGADFSSRRDGLARMLEAAQRRPRSFDVVITMDESRLGRDQYRTALRRADDRRRGHRALVLPGSSVGAAR